ncbi:chromosome segregation protein SMC [Pseudoalteromonas tunicata]|uniref:chromosome segregation protein SMC n=1 Tax=Pseudoalteromonas tunicata TaxID=314281 RepID=UPI00273FA463|nr:chromosome segregation protein SMC [Pseudoalteromonas tunicata]MDP5215268.1 chromosome segregation protein SMC [Pseudoalteromonas tunicata]
MRLSTIKLAGFKSFVEPTKIPFPDQMTCVVGPNGCGKSNVIDAVRWVLGESSAKNLRGDAMTDVIFNGSTNRKPISQASVELLFDNTQGYLAGSLVDRNQVAIKRLVTREGESFYYLNGTKCRKRDITDIFLGTGLGPRSYAIIEQGMISRLIESKPQELRVFIEEAAGVSKYKERRRETETRLRSTKENLERLLDLRQELQTQLEKLTHQASQALAYREFKSQERKLKSQLAVLRWQQHQQKSDQAQQQIEALQSEISFYQQAHTGHDDVLGALKATLAQLNEQIQSAQQQEFQLSNQQTKFEQQKISQQQKKQALENLVVRDEDKLSQLKNKLTELAQHAEQQGSEFERASAAILQSEAQLEQLQAIVDELQAQDEELFAAWQQAQQRSHQFDKQYAQYHHQITSQQLQQTQISAQLADKNSELTNLKNQDLTAQLADLKQQIQQCKTLLANEKAQQQQCELRLKHQTEQWQAAQQEQQALKELLLNEQAQLAALGEVLAQNQGDLTDSLFQQLVVSDGFETRVEQALLHFSDAQVSQVANWQTQISLVWPSSEPVLAGYRAKALSHVIKSGIYPDLLDRILLLDDETQTPDFTDHYWLAAITPSGMLVGRNWSVSPFKDDAQSVLIKIRKIEQLTQSVAHNSELLAQSSLLVDELQKKVTDHTELLEQVKGRIHHYAQQDASAQTKHEMLTAQQQNWQSQFNRITQQCADLSEQLATINEALMVLQAQSDEHALQSDEYKQDAILAEQVYQNHKITINQQQLALSDARSVLHKQALTLENLKNAEQLLQQQQESILQQQQSLTQELNHAKQELANLSEPLEMLVMSIEEVLAAQIEIYEQKTQLQQQLVTQQQLLAEKEQGLQHSQKQLQALEKQLTEQELALQGSQLRANAALEPLSELNVKLVDVLADLPAHSTITKWQQLLNTVIDNITDLGAINLAAIEEFEQAKQRKQYLDEQYQDLVDALSTLEGAIGKIDRETKQLFKATFEQINRDLGDLFPKVFGGGQAYLELTSDDMLESGVTIMARPPGKKNSTIHLLSGGEKALTALSLVFSIFRLNPAPFCMLDEVDAPLDDANVGRFCRLVEEMSQTVQFIYISHNKVAMEMAGRLTGVTMAEPGVSRMVSVDIEQAVEMAKTI